MGGHVNFVTIMLIIGCVNLYNVGASCFDFLYCFFENFCRWIVTWGNQRIISGALKL